MNHNIEFKHFEPTTHVRGLVEELIARLEKHTQSFPDAPVFLRLLIKENATRTLYHVSLVLDLPGKILPAKAERHDVVEAIRDAFDEIERQVEKFKASMRGEADWKRETRREEVRRKQKVEAIPRAEITRELFDEIIDPRLDRLTNFVRRELDFHRKNGDLGPDDPTPEDVVDATVLRAYDEFARRPAHLEIDHWLFKLAIEQIESEIKQRKAEREQVVYVGAVLPDDPALLKVRASENDETEDDADLPDERLKPEEILPDLGIPVPEDAAKRREMQHYIEDTLETLPTAWRRAFVLRYGEGLSEAQVAQVTGLTEDDVKRYIEYAREYLQQRFRESGLSSKENHAAEAKTTAGSGVTP
jgi:RNA polymerase sigma factor (sigma-70 family)